LALPAGSLKDAVTNPAILTTTAISSGTNTVSIDTTATYADDLNDGEIVVVCGCHGFLQRSGST
jgi:hypothetical protein